jgi:hypothetical protein
MSVSLICRRARAGKTQFFRELENEGERIFLAGENPRGSARLYPELSIDRLWIFEP